MIVIVVNNSIKKSFRRTKRIISDVLPFINNRLNIGDIPRRVLYKLLDNLKKVVNRGTKIAIFIESKIGFRGFKCIEVGRTHNYLSDFVNAISLLDNELRLLKIIP